jgi:hypothetical protein|nr:hypothetical protein [uncultured Flavobacterium sp.]
MTDNEIKEIEDRCKLTTPGPWKSLVEGRDIESGDSFIMTGISDGEDIWSDKRGADIYLTGATTADQDFIAHARQDIPKLIAEIKRLKSK